MRRARLGFGPLAWMLVLSACCSPVDPVAPAASSAPGALAPAAPVDVGDSTDDRVVTERVRTLFRQDFEIRAVAPRVGIATRAGVVTLSGDVDTDRQRLVMLGHARATEGVASVVDRITLPR